MNDSRAGAGKLLDDLGTSYNISKEVLKNDNIKKHIKGIQEQT